MDRLPRNQPADRALAAHDAGTGECPVRTKLPYPLLGHIEHFRSLRHDYQLLLPVLRTERIRAMPPACHDRRWEAFRTDGLRNYFTPCGACALTLPMFDSALSHEID